MTTRHERSRRAAPRLATAFVRLVPGARKGTPKRNVVVLLSWMLLALVSLGLLELVGLISA